MRPRVQRVVVVVPARDEEDLLDDCLSGLARARALVDLPVVVCVVLDGCTDGSAGVVGRRAGVTSLVVDHRCVGQARDAGARAMLAPLPAVERETTWLAHTDADSVVPEHWLDHQVDLADRGADLVLGTVSPRGGGASPAALAAWQEAYAGRLAADGAHTHVHGANLGIRASAYLTAGGFPHRAAHEDRVLARRVGALPGAVTIATIGAPVVTSARLLGRVPTGVSADLRRLQAGWPVAGTAPAAQEQR